MSGLPTINKADYYSQLDNNNEKMQEMLKMLFPDISVPYDAVYQILAFLEETNVNALILPRVIRGVHNISIGTGKGQVIVHVRGGTTNVQLREQDDEINTNA